MIRERGSRIDEQSVVGEIVLAMKAEVPGRIAFNRLAERSRPLPGFKAFPEGGGGRLGPCVLSAPGRRSGRACWIAHKE